LLTEVGSRIALKAKSLINEADFIKEIAKTYQNPFAGEIKIGAIPTLAPYLFPKILPNLSRQFKELKVFLIEDKTNILLDKIVNGQVDCGFLALPIDNIDLSKELIFEDKFYLAVHKTNKLFKKKITTQFDLLDQDLLLLEEGHCLRNQALAVCSLKGINENQDFRATSLETLRQMIENGNGITIMPEIAINRKSKNTRYIPYGKPQHFRKIVFVYRKTNAREKLFTEIKKISKNTNYYS
jgi:LysR family hydrogen peroxide-inducible transcriptional activator